MKLLVATVLFCLPLVKSSCDFPPDLWCSSTEIAKKCDAYEQCKRNSQKSSDAGPVNLTLYYESLCPFCSQFINDQLYKTWQTLGPDVLNITLVPYGNAKEEKTSSGDWKFTCQHGPKECTGNLIETCAIGILKDFKSYFPYIYCIEDSGFSPSSAAETCAKHSGIDYSPINDCANGNMGNSLEHKMAEITDALDPPHKYVPWITINGEHTQKINDKAQSHLLKLVCDTYQGPTPSACQNLNLTQDKKCYKN